MNATTATAPITARKAAEKELADKAQSSRYTAEELAEAHETHAQMLLA